MDCREMGKSQRYDIQEVIAVVQAKMTVQTLVKAREMRDA